MGIDLLSRKAPTAGLNPPIRSTIPVRGLSRRLSASVPSALRAVLPVAAWIFVSITLGLLFGFAAVILPPAGAFGIVAIAAVVLLTAMPDLHRVPTKAVRATFFIMIVVGLTIPAYYTLVVPGLPWISVRRMATFALIVVFAITMGGSTEQRKEIKNVIVGSNILATCFIGYLLMTIISTILSRQISTSTSDMTEIVLTWYVPLLATIFVVKTEDDVFLVLRIICYAMIIVALVAIYDFIFRKHFYFDILPHPLQTMVLEASPRLADTVGTISFRNGLPRVSSLYSVSLSLAEFGAMVAPIAYFFILYGKSLGERWLGIVTAILCLIAIFCSGSRGGYNSLIVGTVSFVGVSLVRKSRFDRYSLTPAIGGIVAIIFFVALAALVLLWTRLHNIVLGGGMEAYSDMGRYAQWALGIPKVERSPPLGLWTRHLRRCRRLGCSWRASRRSTVLPSLYWLNLASRGSYSMRE